MTNWLFFSLSSSLGSVFTGFLFFFSFFRFFFIGFGLLHWVFFFFFFIGFGFLGTKKRKKKKKAPWQAWAPQIVWKIVSDGNWVMKANECEKLSDKWWVISDELWVISDEWWKLSDQILLAKQTLNSSIKVLSKRKKRIING